MTTPTVIEVPLRLEPVSRDTFIASPAPQSMPRRRFAR
jgi:hypothetical protein